MKIFIIITMLLVVNAREFTEKELRDFEKDSCQLLGTKSTKVPIKDLKEALHDLKLDYSTKTTSLIKDHSICGICKNVILNMQRGVLPVFTAAKVICKLYMKFSTWTHSEFCENIINYNEPILSYVIKHSPILSPDLACSIILQIKHCYHSDKALTWKSEIPKRTALPTEITKRKRSPNKAKPLKILQLSDLHISEDYEVDGVANCGYPVCCKKKLGTSIFSKRAGKWGDYRNCDLPVHTFLNALVHINTTHKDIDMVYFTGDIIDHTIWKSSVQDNSKLISFTFNTLRETFPNIKVFSVVGNHETTPLNVYPPPSVTSEIFSQQWLYTLLSKSWSPWLPEEALLTVKKQGYYTYLVNNNFRIIALNNNICYVYNWWLMYDTSYLNEQLQWLSNLLVESEKSGQFVHIITHIPPGNRECVEPWEVNYHALVTRFSHIIKGQFFGHTHTDEIKVFYNKENSQPINVGYNGASLTPFTNYNPNYKIYTVDSSTYDILDAASYIFNLTQANEGTTKFPTWYKLYSMREAYGLGDLQPKTLDNLAKNILINDDLLHQYFRYYVRDGDASLEEGCNKDCKKKIRCEMVTTISINSSIEQC